MLLPKPMADLTDEEWKTIGISRVSFEERWRTRLHRDHFSPKIGSLAPDFELNLIDNQGQLTGKSFKLSSKIGTPVGLIFGSYT